MSAEARTQASDAVIDVHGGKMWAENRPGGGTVFRFTLPLGESSPDIPPTDG